MNDYAWELETEKLAPLKYELVPIGLYNGTDLPDTVILDDSYTVYIEIPNPEYDCEVIME